MIGQVHVRQLRVNAPITCESVTHNTLLNTCHDQYSTDSMDQAPYGPNESWHHSFYQQYYNVRGSHGTYDSSGYVVKLHRNRYAGVLVPTMSSLTKMTSTATNVTLQKFL